MIDAQRLDNFENFVVVVFRIAVDDIVVLVIVYYYIEIVDRNLCYQQNCKLD